MLPALGKVTASANLTATAGPRILRGVNDLPDLPDPAATVRAGSSEWTAEQEEKFKAPIRAQYESQGHPYYASARLWDDGVIDPAQTRDVLGLGLSATMNAPIEDTRFGVFRM